MRDWAGRSRENASAVQWRPLGREDWSEQDCEGWEISAEREVRVSTDRRIGVEAAAGWRLHSVSALNASYPFDSPIFTTISAVRIWSASRGDDFVTEMPSIVLSCSFYLAVNSLVTVVVALTCLTAWHHFLTSFMMIVLAHPTGR
ncbi:hypothetical protein SKAU_G00272810 [Synaphobranchus kaupii]|uniref:Uncharacterized protein n=1 Tax=Synaphobranchus kaupii TaxID=118154 RepID=A0A9Q1IQK0_SYNKA|nr:hypothetical protein SKAU_G00272810 [Synaphobranchus kaupii]